MSNSGIPITKHGFIGSSSGVVLAGDQWIPTLDGTTADGGTDPVVRPQSTSGGGVEVWTTSNTSTFTLDTTAETLKGLNTGNTGKQSFYTLMPFALSADGWTIDWTVVLGTGNDNNTNVFLTLGNFEAVGYSPSLAEGTQYFEVVANTGDTNWHVRGRGYPTGESQGAIVYGSQGSSGQAGGNQTSSTNYYRLKCDGDTITAQLFDDADRTSQVGDDDVWTYTSDFDKSIFSYFGVATDDFKINMNIKTISVTND